MLGIRAILFETFLTEVDGAEETRYVYDTVEMAQSFMVHQIQIKDRPVFVLIVRDPNKLTEGSRYHSDSYLEAFLKGRKVVQ